MTISNNAIEELIKELQEQQDRIRKFEDDKRYIKILDCWASRMQDTNFIEIDNIDYSNWESDYSLVFRFLYDAATELFQTNNHSVTIKYKNIYITLEELHGQGCLQTIFISHVPKKIRVDFEDLEQYVESGKKPLRYHTLNTVKKGLDILDILGVEVTEDNAEVATLGDI